MLRPKKTDQADVEKLDDIAKNFLAGAGDEIRVQKGQKSDEEKLRDAHEQMLFAEACAYGDDLVRYVAMHKDLSPKEAAWGFCLGLFCMREDYPDGLEKFDDTADKASVDLVLQETTTVDDLDEIEKVRISMPQFNEEEFKKAATFSELFAAFVDKKRTQLGVSNLQAAYGLGRAFHNLRRTFPADQGGSAVFDELGRRAGAYFAENKDQQRS